MSVRKESVRISSGFCTKAVRSMGHAESLLKDAAILEDGIPRDGGKVPEMAETVFVGFHSYKNRVACGEIRSFCFERAIPFFGIDQLLLTMEDIMDALQYPQALTVRRTLRRVGLRETPKVAPFADLADNPRVMELTALAEQPMPSARVSCLIRVLYRQRASIQGILRIKGTDCCFRSGLELASLLHDFLAAQAWPQQLG